MTDTATLLAYSIPNALQQIISIVSANLLYPVMIVLIILIAGSMIELGGFLFEWRNRHRDLGSMEEGAVRARARLEQSDPEGAFGMLGQSCSNSFVHEFLYRVAFLHRGCSDRGMLEVRLEKLLQDINFEMTKKLERSRFVARVGPMFGLMGTLIPMGPALLGLSAGDIDTLANNLVIAFGTTVVGLMAGAIGFMVATVRARWYKQDISDIEYLSEVLFGSPEPSSGGYSGYGGHSAAAGYSVPATPMPEPVPAPMPAPIPVVRSRPDENDRLGVIGTIVSRSGESVHRALIFNRSGLISAKTAGSVVANSALWMGVIVIVNVVIIVAMNVGGLNVPFNYLLLINLFICALFVVTIYLTKGRAKSRSRDLEGMPANKILSNDGSNFEVPYSDIKRIEIDKSRNIKILADGEWIEMGRVEKSSIGAMGVLHAVLQDRVVEV
ncbi:MAG: MotA/TolQ/ExbB proton channel family protein [Euryarchaeota archaeon]|nr:MotA/TolQ/ExbB proton channel family protein [Euryarchaeota archaeon]